MEFYRSPDASLALNEALGAARRRPWWDRFQARIPQHEDDWRVQWWRKRGPFDSPETWKALRIPALVLIGGEDDTMDLPKNLDLFDRVRTSNPLLEVRVIPGADHGLRIRGELVTSAVDGTADWIHDRRRR